MRVFCLHVSVALLAILERRGGGGMLLRVFGVLLMGFVSAVREVARGSDLTSAGMIICGTSGGNVLRCILKGRYPAASIGVHDGSKG